MLHPILEKVIDKLKSVRLSADEKTDILGQVLSIVEKIEVVAAPHVEVEETETATPSPFSVPTYAGMFKTLRDSFSYSNQRRFAPAFLAIILLFGTGGVSLAAENALPGDPLYALKINVNESVRGLFAISPEAKARLALETSETRLQEAATLSAQGRLDQTNSGILQQEFNKQASQVSNQVASLVSTNNIDTAQDVVLSFESSLKAHEVILEKLSSKNEFAPDSTHINAFLGTLKSTLATTTVARVDLQSQEVVRNVNNQTAIEVQLADTKNKLQDMIDLENSIDAITPLSFDTKAAVSDDIALATSSIAKADVYLKASSSMEAIIVIQQANRAISDAQSAIMAESNAASIVQKAISKDNPPVETINVAGTSTSAVATSTSTDLASAGTATSSTSTASVANSGLDSSISNIFK